IGREFRLHKIAGKLANFATEIEHLGRTNETLLSNLISGEAVDANRKFKETITLCTTAKVIAAGNHLPTIGDPIQGIWRRLILVTFDSVVPQDQVNTRLAEELADELPGILNWALE